MTMAFGVYLGLSVFLSVWSTARCDHIPNGVLRMECRDRYFMIAVDLSFTGNDPRFEAVGESMHSCVDNSSSMSRGQSKSSDDEVFTFNFNLITNHEEKEVTHALNKTCSPSLPWFPREVTCEENYMEVSVRSDVACPTGTKKEDWDEAVQTSYTSATSDWQVMFQRKEQELKPMNLSDAQKQGYMFDLTDGRLVFRTPYGQPDSFSTEVNGVPVEVVHATLFSRQSWVVLMVDLVAACSTHEGSYDEGSGYMMWETPEVLHPLVSGLHDVKVNIGVNGELVEQPVAEQRGYIVEKHNTTVHINIPYNAEGGYRKSFMADDDLSEFYAFHLYLEQISVDEDHIDTRLRFHRTLTTPLLSCPIFTENRTVHEEHVFTVYVGDVPEDVELTAVHLNEQEFILPFANTSSHTITKVVHPNNTHGYTLKVPFDDPVVIQQFSREDALMQHKLDINFTLTVVPENESHFHLVSVMALTDASPPVFDAVCSESGISFKLDHRPFDHLWYISIGSDRLTSELAAQHGYIMSNDSQSLLLNVPLYTQGYEYKLNKEMVTYENEIFFNKKFQPLKNTSDLMETDRVVIQCTYPLAGLHRLFSVYRFESDTVGVGSIVHSGRSTEDVHSPTTEPTTVLQTPVPATRRTTRPGYYRPTQHIKVSNYLMTLSKK
ncbi:hypothetical protein INR49_011879, partial [Caranx melampygus]